MSSEQLADGVNPLDAELAATWDVLKGYSGRDTDLGIARRFGGAAAAYSLRDIGAMNGRVVKARRDVDGDGTDKEEDFSANQVQSGALEDWVNGKLESTLPADVETAAAAYSLRKVKADYGIPVTEVNGTDGFPATITGSAQTITGTSFTVRQFSNGSPDSSEATAVNGVYSVSATKTSTASFSKAIRIQGLEDGKQYTVKGEFRMVEDTTSGGNSAATVDISDDTAGTDEDAVSTTSTTFVPFFIDSGYNSGSNDNWVDFAVASVGSETGTITAEFRNVQIIENNNSAVRIRRSSDDEEVVVGFDSDNKVSASSPVTATPSGSTTATTLGDFINGTDAFVHTWYDQAGSNNAVQETAANQPKIAEGGALLADGVTFDGINDFLQTSGQVLTNVYTGARSLYGVCKINTDSGYIFGDAGNGTNEGTSFYSDTASDKILFTNGKSGTLVDYDNITTIEGSNFLISSNYNNNNTTTIHKNSNNNGYTQGTDTYNFTTSSQFTIGDRQGGSSEATKLNGSVQEIIAYNSDQSDNRFKIESNINNYYGLYNDANEFASNETAFRFLNERSGGTSASSDLTQFTLDVQTASAYVGAKFSSNVLSGDSIYVSFNCTFDNGSPSPKIALRDVDTVLNGGIDSNEENVTEGFNQFTLTSNSSDASGIVWSEGDDNVIFSVTDLKISRIARNGFVETWYDQSGNGNDATQGTAANQPAIVQNGGLNTDGLDFDGSNDLLDITNSLPITGANARSVFAVVNKDVSSSSDNILGIGDNGSGVNSQLWNLASTYGLYYNGGNTVFGAGSLNTEQLITAIYPSTATDSGDTVFFIDGSASSITSNVDTTLATDNTVARIGSGGGSAGGLLDGSLKEIIVFDSDKLSDRTDIEQDIKNFYNI